MNTPVARPSRRRKLSAPIAGVAAGVLVLVLMNAQLITTQLYLWLSPPTGEALTASQVAATPLSVSPEPRIIIKKLSVDAPVIYDMDRTDEPSVQRALQDGTLQFADSALPGQKGNVVIVGHSSNVPWVPGNYKFVFATLEQLQQGDIVFLNYKSVRYVYKVSGSKVVKPDDVSVLQQTDSPTLTLITCTPVGTSLNRLIITAEQIVPSPSTATERTSSGSAELQAGQPLPGP